MFQYKSSEEVIEQHCLNSKPDDIIKGAVEGQVSLFTVDKLQHVDVNEYKYPGGLGLIHLAAEYGQLEVVKLLIAAGADVGLEGPGSMSVKVRGKDYNVKMTVMTALHQAASKRDLNMVEVLLNAGADVNKPDGKGKTPLYHAISRGCCDIVQMLLISGATYSEPEKIMPSGDYSTLYPLHLAVEHKQMNIIPLFLEIGYAIDTMNDSNETALSLAANNGNQTSVEFLLQHGADVKLTPIETYHDRTITKILAKAGANVHGPDGNEAPLHQAIMDHDLCTVKVLIEAGARMDVPYWHNGFLPLTMAIRSEATELVEYFLMQNHDPNECDVVYNGQGEGQSTLCEAVNSSVEIMNLLMEYGADVNFCSESGVSPLLAAATSGKYNAVEFLLKAGAHVNHANGYSSTALHQAVMDDGSIEIVKLLIEYGAEVNAKDKDGLTPLHLSAVEGEEDNVRYLLSAGALINSVSIHGETALHLATDFDNLETVKILMTSGARSDVRDNTGTVPLHLAAVRGLPHIAEYLILKNKCVINYTDVAGATPLHLATFNGHETTVQILLDNGADTTLTYKGELPLQIAQRCGHYSLIKLFDDGVNPVLNSPVSLDTFLESVINTTGIGKVDDTDPDVKLINETVESYMREVLARVAKLDLRFTMEVALSGSVSENCKVGMPNERDIMICLTCFTKSKTFEVEEDVSAGPHYAKVKITDDEMKSLWPEMMVEPANGYILPGTFKRILMENIVDVLLQDDFQPPSSIYYFMNGFPEGSVRHCAVEERQAGFMMTLYWWGGCYKGMEITVDIILAFPVPHSPTNSTRRILSKDNSSEGPFCYLVPKTQDLNLKKYLWRMSTSNIEKEEMLAVSEEAKRSYIKAKVLLTVACSPAANPNVSSRFLRPVPSFFLKTAFFFELDKFPEHTEWQGLKYLDRMVSMFERLAQWLTKGPIPSFFINGVFINMGGDSLGLNAHALHNVSNIVHFLKKHKSEVIDICPRHLCHELAYLDT